MKVLDTLITRIHYTFCFRFERHPAVFEQLEIMSATFVESSAKYLPAGFIRYDLCLLSVSFFLARIIQSLFFLGRSTGLSVTSIRTTSK